MPHSGDALAADGGTSSLSIALVADRPDWHVRELGKALAGLGARAVCVELTACGFDTQNPSGLNIAGFRDRLRTRFWSAPWRAAASRRGPCGSGSCMHLAKT